MLSSLMKQHEKKSNFSKDSLPKIDGKDIKDLIFSYHSLKRKEASAFYQIMHPTSSLMRAMENFYYNLLTEKSGQLNNNECFELTKILFINHYSFGEKSRAVKLNLLQQFNLSVVAALTASAGNIEALRHHFEIMCKSPKNAADIAYAVLSLDTHIKLANKLGIKNVLYANQLSQQIIEQPESATYIVNAYRLILHSTTSCVSSRIAKINSPNELIRNDRTIFLLVKLEQEGDLTKENIENIIQLNIQQLNVISQEVAINKRSVRNSIIKHLVEDLPELSSSQDKAIKLFDNKQQKLQPPLSSPIKTRCCGIF